MNEHLGQLFDDFLKEMYSEPELTELEKRVCQKVEAYLLFIAKPMRKKIVRTINDRRIHRA